MTGDPRSRSELLTGGSIVIRVVVLVATIREGIVGPLTDDLARFREIFVAAGAPYRAFPVEYAPGEVVFIRVFGSASTGSFAARLALLAFAADIAAWLAIKWGWGREPGLAYLLLGTPLLVFLYMRFDLVPVALAAWGAALAIRSRERASGVVFAASILTKVWPVVVLPMLAIQRRRRALSYAIASTLIGLTVWIAISGVDAVRQVATFREATGWDVGSLVGSVVWITTGETFRQEQGAPRIGTVPGWSTGALTAVLILLLIAIWWRAARRPEDAPGAASLAAVGALLVCSPLFSVQYVSWLLPWAAIASTRQQRRPMVWTTAVITIVTGAIVLVYTPDNVTPAQVLLLVRNAAVVALPLLWLVGSRDRVPPFSR
jgi:hypothetical protein